MSNDVIHGTVPEPGDQAFGGSADFTPRTCLDILASLLASLQRCETWGCDDIALWEREGMWCDEHRLEGADAVDWAIQARDAQAFLKSAKLIASRQPG